MLRIVLFCVLFSIVVYCCVVFCIGVFRVFIHGRLFKVDSETVEQNWIGKKRKVKTRRWEIGYDQIEQNWIGKKRKVKTRRWEIGYDQIGQDMIRLCRVGYDRVVMYDRWR